MPIAIRGIVIDSEGRPTRGVDISSGGAIVGRSDDKGVFNVKVSPRDDRIVMTFAREGYISNTKTYRAKANGINTVVIWPVAYRLRFDASRDLDVEFGSSAMRVPANSLAASSGRALRGTAVVHFTLLDITSPLQRFAAPGDFTGRLPDGTIGRLNSYGIFDCGFRDTAGRDLVLRRGAAVEVSIGVPTSITKTAPRQIGYYTFNTKSGVWFHAGSFGYDPNKLTYNGSIVQFNAPHNLDDPQDTTCVTIQVINMYDGSGLPNMQVTANGPQYSSYGTTDAAGYVCLLVDRNASFSIMASGSYGGLFWGSSTPTILSSPNISSGPSDCGDPTLCPFVGCVPLSFATGIGLPTSLRILSCGNSLLNTA